MFLNTLVHITTDNGASQTPNTLNKHYHATERPRSIGTRVRPELTIIRSRYGSWNSSWAVQ